MKISFIRRIRKEVKMKKKKHIKILSDSPSFISEVREMIDTVNLANRFLQVFRCFFIYIYKMTSIAESIMTSVMLHTLIQNVNSTKFTIYMVLIYYICFYINRL